VDIFIRKPLRDKALSDPFACSLKEPLDEVFMLKTRILLVVFSELLFVFICMGISLLSEGIEVRSDSLFTMRRHLNNGVDQFT